MAVLGYLAGCTSHERTVATSNLGEDAGVFATTVSGETTPLSPNFHTIYREDGSRREVVFRGHGPHAPAVWRANKSLIIVAYCDGSIEELQSSLLARTKSSEDARIIRVEVVTNLGLSFAGKKICSLEP